VNYNNQSITIMNASEQSAFYKRFIMASSDEENALRLYAEATKSQENFNLLMAILTRQNGNVPEIIPQLVLPPAAAPAAAPEPIQVPVPAPSAALVQVPSAAPNPIDGTVNNRLSIQQLEHLNTLGARQRRQAIDLLGLNATERKSLVNRLWRLRHPDEVRQNARRSYQNRNNL